MLKENKTYIESAVIRNVAKGDHAAFAELFHHYNARLFSFVLKVTRSELISEDLVQEVFTRVWLNREKLPDFDNPGAWIFRIATNLALNSQRDIARLTLRHQNAAAHLPSRSFIEDRLDSKQLSSFIEEAIRELPARRQQIFRMNHQEGMSYQEIAHQLSISANTVKDHLLLAMRFVRQSIQQKTGVMIAVWLIIERGL